jgi:hypothetical protein
MHAIHLIKRGPFFHFVLRIPHDLKLYFPRKTISRSLKTKDKKQAAVLANATEYEAQKLFMRLRTGMLDKDLESYLINTFLMKGVKRIEAQIIDADYEKDKCPDNPLDMIFDENAEMALESRRVVERFEKIGVKGRGTDYVLGKLTEQLRTALKNKDRASSPLDLDDLARKIKQHTGAKLDDNDKQRLALKLIEAETRLHKAEIDTLSGDWDLLRMLKESVGKAQETPFIIFSDLIEKYLESYKNARNGLTANQLKKIESVYALACCDSFFDSDAGS